MSAARSAGSAARSVPTLAEILPMAGSATATGAPVVPAQDSKSTASIELDLNLDEMDRQFTTVMMPDGSLADASADDVAVLAAAVDAGNRITERVLVDVQRRVDLMLEYRLREALTPALARMTDMFIRDTRNELASTLREIVARAVEAELAKERAPYRP